MQKTAEPVERVRLGTETVREEETVTVSAVTASGTEGATTGAPRGAAETCTLSAAGA